MTGKKCDGVFEGGGVRGIGFAGAISEMEAQGYTFQNVAGTSAGAIAAALVAVGYSGSEIEKELGAVDFTSFRQEGGWSRVDGFGKVINLKNRYGVYKSDSFETWLDRLLEAKGKQVFGALQTGERDERYAYKLSVVASDLTDNSILILPGDLKRFGISPDTFSVARAVRMSMSIPLYYEPERLLDGEGREHIIVDGGLLSNYPIWLLDDGTSAPPFPTFGFKFIPGENETKRKELPTERFVDYLKSLVTTMLEAGDNYHISKSKGDFARSVLIPTQVVTPEGTKVIEATYFDITPEESAQLAENGRRAARSFLSGWDFEEWKLLYR